MRYKEWEREPHTWYAWRPVAVPIVGGEVRIAWFRDVLRFRVIGDSHRWTYSWPYPEPEHPHYIDKTKTAYCLVLLGGLLANWHWSGLGLVLIAFVLVIAKKE